MSKKLPKNVLSIPGRALDLTAKIVTAASSKNSKPAISTLPELITFFNTGNVPTLEKLYKVSLIYSYKSTGVP